MKAIVGILGLVVVLASGCAITPDDGYYDGGGASFSVYGEFPNTYRGHYYSRPHYYGHHFYNRRYYHPYDRDHYFYRR
ncbi:MAG TPA: hypothetical protein VHH88_11650 [Verrucomicrobiae bacterium]|nr:hypothetical protein [Verrucomicrobiae bacterium]